jgi:GNAT superfamily N-acetyltransferase
MSEPRRDTAGAAPEAAHGSVTVRPARPDDLPRVWELVRQLADYERMTAFLTGTTEQLAALMFGGDNTLECRVAEHGERIVGYALFYTRYSSFRTRRRLWLEDLFVEPDARGSGAGAALMREVAAVAIARGCDRLDWDVLDWNQLAIDFYHGQGGAAVVREWTQFGMDEAGLRRLAGERDGS